MLLKNIEYHSHLQLLFVDLYPRYSNCIKYLQTSMYLTCPLAHTFLNISIYVIRRLKLLLPVRVSYISRMYNLPRIALRLTSRELRINTLCLSIENWNINDDLQLYNLLFTNVFRESCAISTENRETRGPLGSLDGQYRSYATLPKRRCLLMISIIPYTSSAAGSKEPISSKVGVYFNY